MAVAGEALDAAADRLQLAAETGVACAPLTDLLVAGDIDAAYQVQRRLTERRLAGGARIVGRKIGLTSHAVQQQVGVDRPDFGVLFADMHYADDELIPIGRLLQPKAEAEVAFRLARDIPDASDPAVVADAVELAFPALEIVDSRIADWRIGITDTVADNASSGVFVLGPTGLPLTELRPVDVTMTLRRSAGPERDETPGPAEPPGRRGAPDRGGPVSPGASAAEVVSQGDGAACLGDPLNALVWLAATMIEVGTPLRAGELVLSGALGPMVAVAAGDVFTADIAPLGTVTARFSGRDVKG
ncbi:fumarylacetoacetate hydrolase family protein [Frankia sp. AiPa1]|uniref:2-keto-4-pentenoate hydratase n=1 Tax=Frankia sp. AiPa1 TaxID=573492 RepID=UPI00202B69FF|nr:fumarylacetoacetate hydrolase family protein [Frankia sp. AiPa1]